MTTTRELFARHRLRSTRQREAVYETLCGCSNHPTAEELHRLVKRDVARLSLATVYNSLEALSRAGLVLRLPTTDGCCRYDAITEPHVHVFRQDTNEIADLPPELSERLLAALTDDVLSEVGHRLGMTIDGVSLQLFGSPVPGGAGAGPGSQVRSS